MTKEEYVGFLKDPRWRRTSARIMKRDGRCLKCGATENLQVHHLHYRGNLKPWEYDDLEMITICRACHEKEHAVKDGVATKKVFVRTSDYEKANDLGMCMFSLKNMEALTVDENKKLFLVLLKVCDLTESNTGKTKLGDKEIRQIMKFANMKMKPVKGAFTELKRLGYLKNRNGLWYVNPSVCWKGDNESSMKAIGIFDNAN